MPATPDPPESKRESIPATVPPGYILQQELDRRGWTPDVLAAIIDKPPQVVRDILERYARISPDTAIRLALALGTPPGFWHDLETAYRFHQAQRDFSPQDISSIKRRRRVYSLTPVDELLRRGWIDPPQSLDDLEAAVCAFLGIKTAREKPALASLLHPEGRLTPAIAAQIAWLRRAVYLAWQQPPTRFEQDRFDAELSQLLLLTNPAEEAAAVPRKLHSMGVHLVIVPELPNAAIEGATYYHAGRYIVALALRDSEINAFWLALMRQLAYIGLGRIAPANDALILRERGTEAKQAEVAQAEAAVEEWAADQLIPPQAYQAFLEQCNGNFNRANVRAFAYEILRHPGIVIGRLKQDGHLKWRWQRQLQVDIRPALEAWIDKPGRFE